MDRLRNFENFTNRNELSLEIRKMHSDESRLTNEQLNYSFQKEIQVPEFKQCSAIDIIARLNRQSDRSEQLEKRMSRLEGIVNKIANTCELNLKLSRENQKKMDGFGNQMAKLMSLLGEDVNTDKENNIRAINTDSHKRSLSRTKQNTSHFFDSTQNNTGNKLSKTRSILSIQDRKREIDKEISSRLKEESAKRKKILLDLRKQSYTQKFF